MKKQKYVYNTAQFIIEFKISVALINVLILFKISFPRSGNKK